MFAGLFRAILLPSQIVKRSITSAGCIPEATPKTMSNSSLTALVDGRPCRKHFLTLSLKFTCHEKCVPVCTSLCISLEIHAPINTNACLDAVISHAMPSEVNVIPRIEVAIVKDWACLDRSWYNYGGSIMFHKEASQTTDTLTYFYSYGSEIQYVANSPTVLFDETSSTRSRTNCCHRRINIPPPKSYKNNTPYSDRHMWSIFGLSALLLLTVCCCSVAP